MARKVTQKDVSEYRALATKSGRDVSALTDEQIIAQIRILRGGMAAPSPSDIEEILGRAKATEKIFQQCTKDALADLRNALADFQALDRAASSKTRNRKSELLKKRAERVIALQRKLLAYPPSMLSPELQKILALVGSWASQAEQVLKEEHPQGEKILLGVTDRLAKELQGFP